MASVDNRVKGRGCRKCNIGYGTSFQEQCLYFYLKQVLPDCQNRFIITTENSKPIEVDIFVPTLKLAIEYDGYFYHKNRAKQDELKNREIRKLGYKFIRIRENNGPEKKLPLLKKYYSLELQCNAEREEELIDIIREILTNNCREPLAFNKMDININRDRMKIYNQAKRNEKERSLAFKFPQLAEEWDPTKNHNVTAWNVLPGSSKRVWWKCKICLQEWNAIINKRVKGQKCPYCTGSKVGPKRSLESENPVMAEMWHPYKNGNRKPNMVLPGSHEKAWWYCSVCSQEWNEPIHRRTSKRGCPFCSGRRVYHGNCLSTKRPNIAKLWHPYKNGHMTPHNVTNSSGKIVWWLCNCGKEFKKPVYRMSEKSCECE